MGFLLSKAQIVRPAFERQSPQASLRAHMDQKRRLRGRSKSLSGPIEHRLQYCPGKSHKVGAEQEDRRRPRDNGHPANMLGGDLVLSEVLKNRRLQAPVVTAVLP